MIRVFRLEKPTQWSWVTLAGADAADFLHRLTTIHVRNLEVNHGAPGFFLNAQGKIRSYFTLWHYGDQDFSFEFDSGANGHWKKELLAAIDQFTFAEKFTLTDVSGLSCAWIFFEKTDELEASACKGLNSGQTQAVEGEIRVCNHGNSDFGHIWISAWARPEALESWLKTHFAQAGSVNFDELETWRVLNLRPRVDVEITESVIPLELGMKDAISENKGCYPGQEVIERIIAMGAPPRRLARIDGEGNPPKPGESVLNLGEPAQEIGSITSVVSCEGKFSALALVRKIHAKEGLPVRFSTNDQTKGAIQKVAPYA